MESIPPQLELVRATAADLGCRLTEEQDAVHVKQEAFQQQRVIASHARLEQCPQDQVLLNAKFVHVDHNPQTPMLLDSQNVRPVKVDNSQRMEKGVLRALTEAFPHIKGLVLAKRVLRDMSLTAVSTRPFAPHVVQDNFLAMASPAFLARPIRIQQAVAPAGAKIVPVVRKQ